EELLEEVAETRSAEVELLAAGSRARPPPGPSPARGRMEGALVLPVGAQFIVLLPLHRVAQHLVGLVDRLEFLLPAPLVLGHVGMVLARELAEGLLDLLLAGAARNAEGGVV